MDGPSGGAAGGVAGHSEDVPLSTVASTLSRRRVDGRTDSGSETPQREALP